MFWEYNIVGNRLLSVKFFIKCQIRNSVECQKMYWKRKGIFLSVICLLHRVLFKRSSPLFDTLRSRGRSNHFFSLQRHQKCLSKRSLISFRTVKEIQSTFLFFVSPLLTPVFELCCITLAQSSLFDASVKATTRTVFCVPCYVTYTRSIEDVKVFTVKIFTDR